MNANANARPSFSPSNEAEDIEGQVEYGKGSKGDKEEHDSKTPPSPDGQTGLKHKQTRERLRAPFGGKVQCPATGFTSTNKPRLPLERRHYLIFRLARDR